METPKEIIEYRPVEAGLALLREKYEGVVFDVATTTGLDDARKARAEIREPRYECEKIRKRLKAPALEYSRRIDTEAARITAELEKLETPIDLAIKAEEEAAETRRESKRRAEMERVASLRRLVEEIREWPIAAVGASAEELRQHIQAREGTNLADLPDEIRQEADEAKDEALEKLRDMLRLREAREAEEARLAAEREAERQRQAAEDKRLREERQRVEAERQQNEIRAAEERARVQRETQEAEERLAAERAAMERDLAQERARLEAERVDRGQAPHSWPDAEPAAPSVPPEPYEPFDPSERRAPQADVGPGTTVMRVRFKKRGGRYHCRVFTAKQIGQTFAKNGDLAFHEDEWPDIPSLMAGAEFIEEVEWP